ncbi:MAG: phenylalanine--tRNA ligase subunit beta [Pseudomonadota bacterium]
MKFTLSWLKEHLDTEASLTEITDALTDLGLELEGVADPAERLGAFTICRVIEAVQHPNADRLRLCRVEAWTNGPDAPSEEVQVVCGAPNARTGLFGVFAPSGTHIPGTGVDLKPGVIRGVESNGMLCSERELELSDDHDGIIDLPSDAPLGQRYIDYAGANDPMIEIAITPNRPDALGIAGVARDLAARGLGTVISREIPQIDAKFESPFTVTIDDDVLAKAPVFCGRMIRGVKNGPSPAWLQQRLRAIGLRPISALVDITNYLTYDINRPLHVFDADKVQGSGLRVHWAEKGSTLEALDDKEYTFEPDMIMISDEHGPEAIAGVMGGNPTGCSVDTVNVFIESAYWDPVTTASTGRRLKIHSDARYRFERGIDPASCPVGADMGAAMIIALCGGEASEMVIAGQVPDTARSYTLRPERVVSLVGMEIARAEQIRILTELGFGCSDDGSNIVAAVPSWRPDVLGEADLVEEIARIASLTKLKSQPLPRATGVGRKTLTPMQTRERNARRTLAAMGLNECVTYSFIAEEHAALFGGGGDSVRLDNPISSEMSHMRPSALPGLLSAAARNQAQGAMDVALFEIGAGYQGGEPGEQATTADAVRVGAHAARHWSGARRVVDLYDAKADAEAVLAALGAPVAKLMTAREAPDWFHPGRSAALKLGPKNTLAVFGELHPKVLKAMDIRGTAVAVSVMLENLPQAKAKSTTRPALQLSNLQAVERDFAFVVDAGVEAQQIVRAAMGGDKKLISGVEVFDIFDGGKASDQLGTGKKSVAIAVRLQPVNETLTDAEIEAVAEKIVASVAKATGAELRGS